MVQLRIAVLYWSALRCRGRYGRTVTFFRLFVYVCLFDACWSCVAWSPRESSFLTPRHLMKFQRFQRRSQIQVG